MKRASSKTNALTKATLKHQFPAHVVANLFKILEPEERAEIMRHYRKDGTLE